MSTTTNKQAQDRLASQEADRERRSAGLSARKSAGDPNYTASHLRAEAEDRLARARAGGDPHEIAEAENAMVGMR